MRQHNMMKALLLLVIALGMSVSALMAQVKIGDNPASIQQGSVLELESTNKGVLPARVELRASNVWAPLEGTAVDGMTVYNTATVASTSTSMVSLKPGYYYWQDNKWHRLLTDIGLSITQIEGGKIKITYQEETYVVGNEMYVKLNRYGANLSIGEELQLVATILPEGVTNSGVVWSSSNENIATVDSTGKVTAISEGEAAVITATPINGRYSAECTVVVGYKLPLEYVAEYNVNSAGDGFATTHEYMNNEQGYFNYYQGTGVTDTTYNPTGTNILNAPAFANYHLPSQAEFLGIFANPLSPASDIYTCISFEHTYHVFNAEEAIEFPKGSVSTYMADYKGTGPFNLETGELIGDENEKGAVYAIKFKNADGSNGPKTVAYRYRVLGTYQGADYLLVIDSKYIGTSTVTIDDISNDAYWATPEVTRVFPEAGVMYNSHPDGQGLVALFMSKPSPYPPIPTDEVYASGHVEYYGVNAHEPAGSARDKDFGYNIRPFLNE